MPAGLDPTGRRGCTRSRESNEALKQQLESKPRERVRISFRIRDAGVRRPGHLSSFSFGTRRG